MKNYTDKEFAFHEQEQNTSYFEGWYYRVACNKVSFAIILGLQQNNHEQTAFIQIVDTKRQTSSYITFSMDQVHLAYYPFTLKLGKNIFTKHYLHIDEEGFFCDLQASGFTPLKTSVYMPTIMGPFAYLHQMECIHSIISMHHTIQGIVKIQNTGYQVQGIGYMEKDRGHSFPSSYIWFQSNTCKERQASFFFSIAAIPIKKLSFIGCIGVLIINGKEFRFATYLGCKSKKMKHNIYRLKQYPYTLYVKIISKNTYPLKAPYKGDMHIHVQESLDSIALVHVYKYNTRIYDCTFTHGGYEKYERNKSANIRYR